MHDHETCDRLMAEAMRKGSEGKGRLEYLAKRCDHMHGHLTDPNPHATEARRVLASAQPAETEETAS